MEEGDESVTVVVAVTYKYSLAYVLLAMISGAGEGKSFALEQQHFAPRVQEIPTHSDPCLEEKGLLTTTVAVD